MREAKRKWGKSFPVCFAAMLASVIFLLTGTASAHVEDWAQPGYNFKAIKKILVYDLDISEVNLETDIAEKNFQSAFWEQAKKQKIEIINLKRAENMRKAIPKNILSMYRRRPFGRCISGYASMCMMRRRTSASTPATRAVLMIMPEMARTYLSKSCATASRTF